MPPFLHDSAPGAVSAAVECLRSGNTLLYPTDTIYGLGCDSENPGAVERVFSMKRRDFSKPFILLAGSAASVGRYFHTDSIRKELSRLWPGPFTVLLPNPPDSDFIPLGPNGKTAVRVPDDPFLTRLFREWDGLLVSTSANMSGEPYIHDWDVLSGTFSGCVDTLICRQVYPASPPSAIIELESGKWHVRRPGPRQLPTELSAPSNAL